jgi:DNA gyrase subunit B
VAEAKAKSKTKSATYDESSVKVLKGLSAVRMRPGMYMGERGNEMVRRMLKEIVDNAIDEALAGRNNYVETVINLKANEYIVADAGGGIPVGKHAEEKVSVLELLFSSLHAGGKFDSSAYKQSSGTHGVGAACTNALSDEFIVWTKRTGTWYSQTYEMGVKKTEVTKVKSPPKEILNRLQKDAKDYGTIIYFRPDQKVVSVDSKFPKPLPKNAGEARLEIKNFVAWTRMIALLNVGLEMVTTYEDKKKTVRYLNKKGLEAIVKHILEQNELDGKGKPFVLQTENLDIAVQWSNYEELDHFKTYVNCGLTRDGGKHLDGFRNALGRAISKYKTKSDKFSTVDCMYGLVGVLNYKMSGAEFSSQTKDRLTSNVNKEVEEVVLKALTEFFDANKTLVKTIIRQANAIGKGRDNLTKAMKAIAGAKKGGKSAATPDCLISSETKNPEERELYIVEGDSAAGTCKLARFPRFQEVFKLTGKPANATTLPLPKVLEMKALQNLIVALGINTGSMDLTKEDMSKMTFNTKGLRIGSVYVLADADVDGKHISCLLLAMIWRVVPDLIREGKVFIVDAPLYNAFHNNKRYFGATFEDVAQQLPKGASTGIISRAKGWGEISADMLRYVAFDQKTRRVLRVRPPKNDDSREYFRDLMGEQAAVRRELLGLQ